MRISVCMIVRDEEAVLSRSLASIPSTFETVVVDTGSVDRTVEIARSMGARVFHYEWQNDFAAARNESIRRATGDYILLLDADEELVEDVEQQIELFVREYPLAAASVVIHNLMNEEIHKHRMVRFFPNLPKYRFAGVVHEKLMLEGEPAPFEHSHIQIKHYGYERERYEQKSKKQRYLQLYHAHLEHNPDDGYMLYQLGKLYFSTGDYKQAVEVLLRCAQQNESDSLYFPVMLVMLGYALKNIGMSSDAEQLLSSYVPLYPTFPDLPFLMGLLAMDTGKLANIEQYFLLALQIGETDRYSSVAGTGSYKAAYNLGVFYEITGQLSKAEAYYRIAADQNYEPARLRLAML